MESDNVSEVEVTHLNEIEILDSLLLYFSDPAHWTKKSYMRNKDGGYPIDGEDVVSCCLVGGVGHVAGVDPAEVGTRVHTSQTRVTARVYHLIERAMVIEVPHLWRKNGSLVDVNDDPAFDYEMLLRVLRRALTLVTKEIGAEPV